MAIRKLELENSTDTSEFTKRNETLYKLKDIIDTSGCLDQICDLLLSSVPDDGIDFKTTSYENLATQFELK